MKETPQVKMLDKFSFTLGNKLNKLISEERCVRQPLASAF